MASNNHNELSANAIMCVNLTADKLLKKLYERGPENIKALRDGYMELYRAEFGGEEYSHKYREHSQVCDFILLGMQKDSENNESKIDDEVSDMKCSHGKYNNGECTACNEDWNLKCFHGKYDHEQCDDCDHDMKVGNAMKRPLRGLDIEKLNRG